MRSLPPCDLQLYTLINHFFLKSSFGGEKRGKKRLIMILSVLVFGFGTSHDSLFPQVQEEEPGKQPGRTR